MRYDDADGAPIVEVAKLDPDVILATNSGITRRSTRSSPRSRRSWPTPTPRGGPRGRPRWRWSARPSVATTLADEVEGGHRRPRWRLPADEDYPELAGHVVRLRLPDRDRPLHDRHLRVVTTTGSFRHARRGSVGLTSASIVDKVVAARGVLRQHLGRARRTRSTPRSSSPTPETVGRRADVLPDDSLVGQIPALQSGHVYGRSQDKHVGLAITNPTPRRPSTSIENFVPDVAEAVDGSS